jgi:hypothetical protein
LVGVIVTDSQHAQRPLGVALLVVAGGTLVGATR